MEEDHPDYVVAGLDYDVTYHKFEVATLAVKKGAKFIGTNADTNLPNERGLVPGAGSVIAFARAFNAAKGLLYRKARNHYYGKGIKGNGVAKGSGSYGGRQLHD